MRHSMTMRSLRLRNSLAVTALSKSVVTVLAFLSSGKHFTSVVSHSSTLLSAAKKNVGRSISSISRADENMAHVQKSVEARADEILNGLQNRGWVVIDNFLGSDVCSAYRSEAVGFYSRNEMTISKSTRWDSEKNSVVTYDKHNVFATQLNGGESYYDGPRLHEYVVSLVKSIVPLISLKFPEACLNPVLASNKLAVCTGDGSYYDKHYDNSGGDDLRKLTVLYYLNPKWREALGGCFRIYENSEALNIGDSTISMSADTNKLPVSSTVKITPVESNKEVSTTDISPIGDRLLIFWSDRLVHSVQPSQAPRGAQDHRYAFTVWITADHPGAILNNDTEVLRHFNTPLQKGIQG